MPHIDAANQYRPLTIVHLLKKYGADRARTCIKELFRRQFGIQLPTQPHKNELLYPAQRPEVTELLP